MNDHAHIRIVSCLCGFVVFFSPAMLIAADSTRVDFNRDIRPIFANKCFNCHGPMKRNAKPICGLTSATRPSRELDSGETAIVPGDRSSSSLLRTDHDRRRRHAHAAGRFGQAAIHRPRKSTSSAAGSTKGQSTPALGIRGADAAGHARDRAPPDDWTERLRVRNRDRRVHPRAALAEKPATDAGGRSSRSLIRRVTLDLTGLPPTPAEVDAFLADESSDAYEKLVDRLLASPRYGEHMARYWLDLARYGDTHGLHLDNERQIWPYRDWVVRAFNRNLPYDQFTIEQLAGDLLPDPTREQLIATGFCRCNVSTNEGGSIEEEVYVRNNVDRVETMSTVFLGLAGNCAVCHDHKYDPLTQKEFYQFFAFFNSNSEKAMDGNALHYPPMIPVPRRSRRQQTAVYEARLGEIEAADQDSDSPTATTKTRAPMSKM